MCYWLPAKLMLGCIVYLTLSFMLLTHLCMCYAACATNSGLAEQPLSHSYILQPCMASPALFVRTGIDPVSKHHPVQ